MLELVDDLRRHLAHVLDRVLVAEPVRALDRVVHVPEPVVLGHVAERGADAALRRDRVRARRETPSTAPRPTARPRRAAATRACRSRRRRRRSRRTCGRGGHAADAPQQLQRPAEIGDQHDDGDGLEQQAHARGLDVVHQDVAHADPRVVEQRHHEQERRELEAAVREEIRPQRIVDAAVPQRDREHQQRVDRHDDGGQPLDQPVHEAVMRADGVPARHHSRAPRIERQRDAQHEHHGARPARGRELDAAMDVEQQIPDARAEVMQVGPQQADEHELRDGMREARLHRRVALRAKRGSRTRRRAAAESPRGTGARPTRDAGSTRSPATATGFAASRDRPGAASRFGPRTGHGGNHADAGAGPSTRGGTRSSRRRLCIATTNYSARRALSAIGNGRGERFSWPIRRGWRGIDQPISLT